MRKTIIIDTKYGDVTGNGVNDIITLTGNHLENDESLAFENIQLIITNNQSKLINRVPLQNIVGYQPTLLLFPFRTKEKSDILVTINSGGSGGFTYCFIFGYDGNKLNTLFTPSTINNLSNYQVNYLNQYQVQIINNELQTKYILDIKYKDNNYLEELYYKNGILKKTVSGDVLGLNQLFPIDVNNDGVFEILVFQRVIGLYNADLLGYLQTILSWHNKEFKIFFRQQYLAQLGFNSNSNKRHF